MMKLQYISPILLAQDADDDDDPTNVLGGSQGNSGDLHGNGAKSSSKKISFGDLDQD